MSYTCKWGQYKTPSQGTIADGWECIETRSLSQEDSDKYYQTGLYRKEKNVMYNANLYGYVWTKEDVLSWD